MCNNTTFKSKVDGLSGTFVSKILVSLYLRIIRLADPNIAKFGGANKDIRIVLTKT